MDRVVGLSIPRPGKRETALSTPRIMQLANLELSV